MRICDTPKPLFFIVALSISAAAFAQAECGRLYVDARATGARDGSSWADAFTRLQDAIFAAEPGNEIWVAAGVYLPTHNRTGGLAIGRDATFLINKDIRLYGGFLGVEHALEERDPARRLAILSGDIGMEGVHTDNAHQVVWVEGVSERCVIDGFHIRHGQSFTGGGGIYLNHTAGKPATPRIRHCVIEQNSASGQGGGIYSQADQNTPPFTLQIEDCVIRDNSASGGGGIFFSTPVSPNYRLTLRRCVLRDNKAGGHGGGMQLIGAHLSAEYCQLLDNQANRGGGANLTSAQAQWRHCEVSGNISQRNGGGLRLEAVSSEALNCVFQGNRANILSEGFLTTNAGGAVMVRSGGGRADFHNCVFTGNQARSGAALFHAVILGSTAGQSDLINCTFAGNNANNTILRNAGLMSLRNGIVYGNRTGLSGLADVRTSIVQGGAAGSGNLDVDPNFILTPNFEAAPTKEGDTRLRPGSPAIDNGDNAALPSHIVFDPDERPRFIRCRVDRGAYEFGVPTNSDLICHADRDGDGFGDPAAPAAFCDRCPPGFVANANDCDDQFASAANRLPPPRAEKIQARFCPGETDVESRTISVAGAEQVVWVLRRAPQGSRYAGAEPLTFTPGSVNSEFFTSELGLTMCPTPQREGESIFGVWEFEVYTVSDQGCAGAPLSGFIAEVMELPEGWLEARPNRICQGDTARLLYRTRQTSAYEVQFGGTTITLRDSVLVGVLVGGENILASSRFIMELNYTAGSCHKTLRDSVFVEYFPRVETETTLNVCPGAAVIFSGEELMAGDVRDFTFASANGCDSMVRVRVVELPAFESSLELRACAGATVGYNGVELPPGAERAFTFATQNGCDSIVRVRVVELPAFESSLELRACAGATVGYNGVELPAGAERDFTFATQNGCDSIVRVRVVELPVFESSLELRACAGATVSYNGVELPAGAERDFTFATQNGCDSIVRVRVVEIPTSPETLLIFEICPGRVVNYHGEAIPAGAERRFHYISGAGCDSSVLVRALEIPPIPDTEITLEACAGGAVGYGGEILLAGSERSFRFSSQRGCDSIVHVWVEPLPELKVALEDLELTCEKPEVEWEIVILSGDRERIRAEWSDGHAGLQRPVRQEGRYTVRVSDACQSKFLQARVVWAGHEALYIPNAFSPNEDGVNDLFQVFASREVIIEQFDLRVFDRWGSLLYQSRRPGEGWDGRARGLPQPAGVYVWMLQASGSACGRPFEWRRQGDLFLAR
jgi:gliding motility-associated-like protein